MKGEGLRVEGGGCASCMVGGEYVDVLIVWNCVLSLSPQVLDRAQEMKRGMSSLC